MRKGTAMSTIAQRVGLAAIGAVLALGLATDFATGTAEAAPNPQVRTEAINPGGMYGNPTAAAPFWQRQSLDDCALMAAADVIGELTGHEPTAGDISALAQRLPTQSPPRPLPT